MKSPSATAIDRIITASAAPLLKEAGYRKRGRSFHAAHEGTFRVASFQASRWNTPESVQFTLNLGVTVPGFHEAYTRKPFPTNPASAVEVISIRIGFLRLKNDHWWEIGPESNHDEVAQDVATAVRDHALPYLAGMDGLAELCNSLRGPTPGIEAVHKQCLAWLLVQAGVPVHGTQGMSCSLQIRLMLRPNLVRIIVRTTTTSASLSTPPIASS